MRKIFVGIVSLCPPSVLYDPSSEEKPGIANMRFSLSPVFDSSYRSPIYSDGMWTFRPDYDYRSWIVIEVRQLEVKANTDMKPLGWTAIPTFHKEKYVRHGLFQLPLFQGTPNRTLIFQLCGREPGVALSEMLLEKQVKYLDGASVFIRISNGMSFAF
jgi:hypothetical protein